MKSAKRIILILIVQMVLVFGAATSATAQNPSPAPTSSGTPAIPGTQMNGETLSSFLGKLVDNFVIFKQAFAGTIEGTLGGYFAVLAYILAWIIAVFYFVQQFVQGEWDAAQIGRFTGSIVVCLLLLAFCGDVDNDGRRGDLVKMPVFFGYHLAFGEDRQEPTGSYINRLVNGERTKFNENYKTFVENKLMVKIGEEEMPVKYPGMQGIQLIAATAVGNPPKPGSAEEAEMHSQGFMIGVMFQAMNFFHSIIEIIDFFLLVLYSFGTLICGIIAPFMCCVFVNRDLRKRFTYPFMWTLLTVTVIFPVISQTARYFAFLSANMALGTGGNPIYFYDPDNFIIITNGDPTPMIAVACLTMLISIVLLVMSLILSYSFAQGKLVESMSGLIANTFAGLSSVGIGAYVSSMATRIGAEGEIGMINAQQQSTMERADAQLKNQNDMAQNARITSDKMTEAQHQQQILGATGQRESSQMSAYGQALQGFASTESQRIQTVNGAIASAANTMRNLDKDEKAGRRGNFLDHLDKTNSAESRELAERIRTQPEVFDLVMEDYQQQANKLGALGTVATALVGKDTAQAWSYSDSAVGHWLFGDAKKGISDGISNKRNVAGGNQQEIYTPNTPLFEGADGKHYNAMTGNQVKLPQGETGNQGNIPPGGGQVMELNGVPLFKQGDSRWGGRKLGSGSNMADAGCATSSMAMMISKNSGKNINPGQLDNYLDNNGGYSGNGIKWGTAAGAVGLSAQKTPWSVANINSQLDKGKSVVAGVDYKPGSRGGAGGTDHWVTLTGRQGNTYFANDPATGKAISMSLSGDGQLVGGRGGNGNPYRTTGQMVTTSGGLPSSQLLQKSNSDFTSPKAKIQPIAAYQGGTNSLPATASRTDGVQFNNGQQSFQKLQGVTNPAVAKVLAKQEASRLERDNSIAGSRVNMERRNQVLQESTAEGRQAAQIYMQDTINTGNRAAEINRGGVQGNYQMSIAASDTNFQYSKASADVGRQSGLEVNQMNYDTSTKTAKTQFDAESRAAQITKDASLENLYKKNMSSLVQSVGNSTAHQLSELFERASKGF